MARKKTTRKKKQSTAGKIAKATGKGLWAATKLTAKGLWWTAKKTGQGVAAVANKTKATHEAKKAQKQELDMKQSVAKSRPKNKAKKQDLTVKETQQGNFQKFNQLLKGKSTIGIILGARGTGKSALGLKVLENVHAETNRPVAAMGFRPELLPSWIDIVEDIENIQNGSFILVDESGITFSSRKAMSSANNLLTDLILVARHKDLSILFISQNSSNIEINIIRQADYLFLKPSSLLQSEFERKKIKSMYDAVKDKFDTYQDDRGIFYIFSHNFEGFASNPLPSFWSDSVSKSFK